MNGYREPVGIDKMAKRGPFTKCPACGVSLQYNFCTDCGERFDPSNSKCIKHPALHDERFIQLHWHIGAKPVYCDLLNRFVLKKTFWKTILCEYLSVKHLHQSCYSCGWLGVAETESEDA
jgi:hypothetical protein